MAQFKNNQFTNDSNAEHTIRCEMFVSGAAEHGAELEFRGTLVADITAHLDAWKALEIQHEDEKGDVEAATGLINQLKAELEALIVQGRYFVNSVLSEVEVEGVDEHDIRQDFGVEGKIPDGAAGLIDLGRQMAAINAKYILEASPYAMPAAPFAEIGTVAEALFDALDARKVEHREQMHVGKLKEIERKVGDRLLSRAFNWACAVWGYDEPKLEDLGFVPKSQIWTPGSPDPEPGGDETPWGMVQGLEVSIDPINNIYIKWKKVATAEKYTLLRELVPIGSTPPVLPYSVYKTGIPPLEEYCAYGDTDHDPGFAYYYSVVAINTVGQETEPCPPKGVDYV